MEALHKLIFQLRPTSNGLPPTPKVHVSGFLCLTYNLLYHPFY